jgi:hypothetical protein
MKNNSNKIAFYFFMGVEVIAAIGMIGYTVISTLNH